MGYGTPEPFLCSGANHGEKGGLRRGKRSHEEGKDIREGVTYHGRASVKEHTAFTWDALALVL